MTEQPDGQDARLAAFLEAAKAKGASDEFLVRLLKERGFQEKKIYDALGGFYERVTGVLIPRRAGRDAENAKDAFFYLLSFSALGTWSIGLGSLLFTLLELWLPESGARRVRGDPSYGISGSLASVIVGFPVYLLAMRFILRDLGAHPENHESGVRKWLTYIALFVASGIVTGDLITFLAFFLRGGLTVRFVLKVLTVLVIAGGVFWYYVASMKRALSMQRKDAIFVTAATVLVLAAVSAGMWTLGGPQRQREAAGDSKRVADLRAIAGEIRAQWTRVGESQTRQLPASLSALVSAPGAQPLNLEDAATSQPYEYLRREGSSYELCATFTRIGDEYRKDAEALPPSFWDHPIGRRCFVLDASREVPR